ncbi:MAG TPA: DUF4383 domain-containing protein [Candidatus Saccharimonadia bacterium]|nr:DUF4383 domain-containing protein [Candidatus Saccharimonadia bacterium]
MTKHTTLMLGVGFTFLGFLGYLTSLVPASDKGGLVLGLFSNSPLQVSLYLLTGLTALWCLKQAKKYVGLWTQVVGITYALITLASVVQKGSVLGLVTINTSDTVLFFAVAVMALTHMLSDPKDA